MDEKLKKIYVREKDIWGLPQVYKGVEFFPIKLKEVDFQTLFYRIFQYPKNYVSNKQILKMSYLKYLLYVIDYNKNGDKREISEGLLNFLKYCTRSSDVEYISEYLNNPDFDFIENVVVKIKIDDKIFTEQDFDIIREIVLQQNGLSIEYVESFNPEFEELLTFIGGELKNTTLEDEIFSFASLMNKTIKEIEDYTLYQFKKHLHRLMFVTDYKLYNPLEVSGQIKSKTGGKLIQHYMKHLEEQKRYDSILIPKEEFLQDNPEIPDEQGRIVGLNKHKK